MQLIFRRASDDRYDVFNGERIVGRIGRPSDLSGSQWFWGATIQSARATATTLDEAKAAFRPQIA